MEVRQKKRVGWITMFKKNLMYLSILLIITTIVTWTFHHVKLRTSTTTVEELLNKQETTNLNEAFDSSYSSTKICIFKLDIQSELWPKQHFSKAIKRKQKQAQTSKCKRKQAKARENQGLSNEFLLIGFYDLGTIRKPSENSLSQW